MERVPVLPRISDYVGYFAERDPQAIAVVHGETRTDWQSLAREVDACARAYMAAGLGKGDRVCVLSTPRQEFWVTFLAACRIGAVWTGLNPRYTHDEMLYVVRDSTPGLIISLDCHLDRAFSEDVVVLAGECGCAEPVLFGDTVSSRAFAQWQTFDTFLGRASDVSDEEFQAAVDAVRTDDPAMLVYTSGSTGRPKGAIINHYGPSYCSHFQNRHWGARQDRTRLINFFPINHVACVVDISCFALVGGGTLVFMEQFDPADVLRVIARERITVLGGVPTMLQLIFARPELDSTDLSSLETIAIGGAAAPKALVEKIRGYAPLVSTAYGMTETIGHVTFSDPDASVEQLANTIGRPVPEYDLRIADATGTPVPPGEEGEIQVRGDFVFAGYYGMSDATAEAFTDDGWMKTGDVGVERPDGYWQMVGRMKEMFKSGGYNVYPREIEICLESHPDVEMAAVVGVPDALYQEVGHAYCQVTRGATLDPETLRAYCRQRLANYKIPKRFTVCAELPTLPLGKIDKQALKREAAT